jgi:hypothetical protein
VNRDRFPGYDVLSQVDTWDDVTKGVVLRRLGPPRALSFFSPDEEAIVRPLADRLLGLEEPPRPPVVEMLDARLSQDVGPGYRHDDMPDRPEAWRRSLHALEEDARKECGVPFADLETTRQRSVLERIRTTEGDWHGLPAAQLWTMWMSDLCTVFYSHPWAWNEIGFGGPAYPRGYRSHSLLSPREPWEVADADGSDPVPWARRVEDAQRRQS